MADPKKKLVANIEADFFVDSTCINCDTCRQIAPLNFSESEDYSFVNKVTENDEEFIDSYKALLSCPTGSIGYTGTKKVTEIINEYPEKLVDEDGIQIYFNGFTSVKSYAAKSYFLQTSEANWLIDSPRYVKPLVEKFKAMGGIDYIFLSHRDDVADADKYAKEFGAKRIIHESELSAQPDSEIVIQGEQDCDFNSDIKFLFAPGHTKGHLLFYLKNKYLFTGDHLSWSRRKDSINAFKDFCWYSWELQLESLAKLLEVDFEWLLPGHGMYKHLSNEQMRAELRDMLEYFSENN